MQANNDQNWAEDGAFWDEAWTDMNRRLDEAPPRRKRRAAWWWYTGGFLALLLVVTPGVVASIFNGDGGPETRPAPLKAPAPHPAAAPEKEVYAAGVITDQETDEYQTASTPAIATQGLLQMPDVPQGKPEKFKAVKTDRTASTPAIARQGLLQMPDVPQRKPEKFKAAKTDRTTVTPPSEEVATTPEIAFVPPPSPPGESPAEVSPTRAVPAAVGALPLAALPAFPVPNSWALPAVEVGKARRAALYLEAGALSAAVPNVSGFYVGMGYRIPLGKRLSLPLSIRYRRQSLPVSDFPTSGRDDLFAVADPNQSADSVFNAGNPVSTADRLNFTDLKTEAVELTTGISYAFSPRLRATVGLNVAYMTRAELYVSSLPTANGFSPERSFSLLSNALDASFADRADGFIPDLDPLQFSGNLSVRYELTPRLGVSAAGTYLLRQPDRAEVIGLPAARAEVGLRWRLW